MIELIINYPADASESELDQTIKSFKKYKKYLSTVSICIHPPHKLRNKDRYKNKLRYYFGENLKWNMHLLTYNMNIFEVINFAAEKSNDKYYMFVNCGYKLKDNILNNLDEADIFFIDPEDEQYNGFICNTRVHKMLLGFGEKYSLIYKIEEKLKQLKEINNATTTA